MTGRRCAALRIAASPLSRDSSTEARRGRSLLELGGKLRVGRLCKITASAQLREDSRVEPRKACLLTLVRAPCSPTSPWRRLVHLCSIWKWRKERALKVEHESTFNSGLIQACNHLPAEDRVGSETVDSIVFHLAFSHESASLLSN